ncbi:ISL3 family transposase [Streptomyces sp. YIM S03343]
MDEFAVRRGRTYATVLVDMHTRRPVDVLVDRTAHTFAARLREHPEVRVVCQDRTGSFRDGAHAGAPQARQVADARHLLHNLAEAVERVVGRHRADRREPLTVQAGQDDVRPTTQGALDVHGRQRPLVARTRELHQQIHAGFFTLWAGSGHTERRGSRRLLGGIPQVARGGACAAAMFCDHGPSPTVDAVSSPAIEPVSVPRGRTVSSAAASRRAKGWGKIA